MKITAVPICPIQHRGNAEFTVGMEDFILFAYQFVVGLVAFEKSDLAQSKSWLEESDCSKSLTFSVAMRGVFLIIYAAFEL